MTIDSNLVAFAIFTTDHGEFLAKLGGTERYHLWKWSEVSRDYDGWGRPVIVYEMKEGDFVHWLGDLSTIACEAFQLWTFVPDEDDDDDDEDDFLEPFYTQVS